MLGLIQFMLILDITVVNVALPRIQHDLKFSESGLAWVVNGYILMAGGLLLLGGRLADISAAAGCSCSASRCSPSPRPPAAPPSTPACSSRRASCRARVRRLAAPASLGLIALLFPDPRERMKALGLWGGIAGLGGTSGTVISGALVNYVSWRWIFFVNLPVAVFALRHGAATGVREPDGARQRPSARLRRGDHRHRRPDRGRRRAAAGRHARLGLQAGRAAPGRWDRPAGRDDVDRGDVGRAAHPAASSSGTGPGSSPTSRPCSSRRRSSATSSC